MKNFIELYKNQPLLKRDSLSILYLEGRGLYNREGKKDIREVDTSIGSEMLLPITNNLNEIKGVLRVNLDWLGEKEKFKGINSSKKVHGEIKGNSFKIGPFPNETLHLAEGPETALSIFEVLKEPVWASIGANNLINIEIPETVKIIHIWADNDSNRVGQTMALKLATILKQKNKRVIIHIPSNQYRNNKKSIDYNDVLKINPEIIKSHYQQDKQFQLDALFEPIKPLPIEVKTAPKFERSMFPKVISDFAFPLAESIGGPVDFILAPLIVSASLIISDFARIRPKRKDKGWILSPNLYGVIIGKPSVKKSPLMNKAIEIFQNYEAEENSKSANQATYARAELIALEQELNSLKSKKNKSEVKVTEEFEDEKIEKIAELLRRKESLEKKLTPMRLISNQFTLEKLIQNLSSSEGKGLILYRDELFGLLDLLGKKGNEGWEAFFTEGWNGDGVFKYETKGGGQELITPLTLSIIGGIQPKKIKSFLQSRNNILDSGLFARFQFLVFPEIESSMGRYKDEVLPEHFKNKLNDSIQYLLKLRKESTEKKIYKFSEEAQNKFEEYYNEIQSLASSNPNEAIQSHFSKYQKLLPSLSLIIELFEESASKSPRTEFNISESSLDKAFSIVNLLSEHALKLYESEINQKRMAPLKLLKKIEEGVVPNGMTIRELERKAWSGLSSKELVSEAISILNEHNFIKTYQEPAPSGGRKSHKILINPVVLESENEETTC